MADPVVIVSSFPPRLCGIGTFAEEAREFMQKYYGDRDVLMLTHTDGEGEGVIPIMDPASGPEWWKPVAEKLKELNPYAVHLEHEYGLYEHIDADGNGDHNQGFLDLLSALDDVPTIVEPHTVHGRLRDSEAHFIKEMTDRADVVLFKASYQKWRLDWTFPERGYDPPTNIMVIPHGARPDRRYGIDEVPELREELGLDKVPTLSNRLVGLIGWIQSNKRWDIVTDIWEDVQKDISAATGEEWDLLGAGTMRDPNHEPDYKLYKDQLAILESKGLAHFHEFVPRGDVYYKMMAVCDFIILPSTDETQSGTLARIIALNKPYITSAPMEGLTSQTLESDGGLLFTNKKMLRDGIYRLATDEGLRMRFGNNLKNYLEEVVSWEVVAEQYAEAHRLARVAVKTGEPVCIAPEF